MIGFGFARFAICWAWINFSWFSSAYDTDVWIFRFVTMVQMIISSIVATGAGLHVASYFIEHKARISPLATVLSVAVPVGAFLGLIRMSATAHCRGCHRRAAIDARRAVSCAACGGR